MQRIIITGVAGFIGSNLAKYLLKKNYVVVGIDNLSYGIREQVHDDVEFHLQDIRSEEIVKLIQPGDIIFHLAAKNCISDCQNDPVETAQINISGTVNMFQCAVKAKAEKIIYAESSALYEGDVKLPSSENNIHPESFYAISKQATMLFADAYRRYYDLKCIALRYFCVYGPNQDYRRTVPPVMSAFILKLMKNETPVIYGDGNKKRDFIHVDDVNAFHLKCIEDNRTDNTVFNVGSGINYSMLDIYKIISKLLEKNISPDFNHNLPGEAQETLADIDRAKKLGWHPTIDIISGLKSFIDYYRAVEIPCRT